MTAEEWADRVELLEGMLTSGVLISRHAGKHVEFRTLREIREALTFARGMLRRANGNAKRLPGVGRARFETP